MRRLRDREMLQKSAREDDAWQVREAAVRRVRDQLTLRRCATADRVWQVRRAAIERVRKPELLINRARNERGCHGVNVRVQRALPERLAITSALVLVLHLVFALYLVLVLLLILVLRLVFALHLARWIAAASRLLGGRRTKLCPNAMADGSENLYPGSRRFTTAL